MGQSVLGRPDPQAAVEMEPQRSVCRSKAVKQQHTRALRNINRFVNVGVLMISWYKMCQISPERHAAGCYLAAQAVRQQWSKQELMQRVELCEDEDVLQEKQEKLELVIFVILSCKKRVYMNLVEEAYCALELEQQRISALEMELLADPSFCH